MRLFFAAPTDLAPERRLLAQVVDRINERTGATPGDGRFLELTDWNETVTPLANQPENVAFRNLGVSGDDVFLGLTWLRFDSEEERNGDAVVATERDFELAYSYWKTLPRPRAVFMRCMRLPTSLADIDPASYDRVGHFFRRFDAPEKNRFAFLQFAALDQLEQQVEKELTELLERASAPVAGASVAPTADRQRSQLRGSTQFEKKMEPGKAYEVSFLSLEIARWQDLERRHGEGGEGLRLLSQSFLDLVKSTAKNYGGEVFSWQLDGGLVMFWSKRSYDHAIMTGLKVLHNLPVFNLDAEQNPLGEEVQLRASAHDAVIVFQLPIEDISSADLNFVLALQRDNTDAGELTIPRRLLERIDERLQPHFKFKGRYEREPIYSCKLPAAPGAESPQDLEETMSRLRRQTSLVMGLLKGPASTLDVSALDAVSNAVDESYSLLNKFCLAHSRIDPAWSAPQLAELASTSALMRREEATVWGKLRECLADQNIGAGTARRLEALVHSASRRRSRPVVILEKLEERCASLSQKGMEPTQGPTAEVNEELRKGIDRLIRADELDNETALTELLLNQKAPFLEYVTARVGQERHGKLMAKLWETADLALLDDLFSIREHKRAGEALIFDAVVRAPSPIGSRFRIVQELLRRTTQPQESVLVQLFEQLELEPSRQDLEILWRCMVLGHGDEGVRGYSAQRLSSHSVWQVVSHPAIPIHAIYAIGERMGRSEGEDAKKIFFDCTRARIEQAVEGFSTREEFNAVTKLIMLLLGFGFLVETGYFERFDDILRKFLNRAQTKGLKVDYFERLRATLESARANAGDRGPSKAPAGIKGLPLTIQRRLAGESRYIYWFVTHPDPRIACETLRHIGLMHVERVLRMREINSSVLQAILRKPELFTRHQALVAALNHPKCTQEFATKYIPGMTRTRQGRATLEKITQNPSASPVVRATSKRALSNVARLARR
ncbi:MAG: hypothetical protein AAGN66_27740 [Acidobacteriota bacterium]